MTHMEYASNSSRSIYDDQSGPYLNVGSTPVPTVTSFSPSKGSSGTKFCVYISSLYDLTTTTLPSFYLMCKFYFPNAKVMFTDFNKSAPTNARRR